MKGQVRLNHIVAGAISPGFEGYGGIILTTPSYMADIEEAKDIVMIDKEFDTYFDSYEGNFNDLLQISIPIIIKNKLNRIVYNARKRFTSFIEANRFYKRIEYFYVSCDNLDSPLDLMEFLPEMQQWGKKNMGGLIPIEVSVSEKINTPSNLTKAIFASLFYKTPIAIKLNDTNPVVIQRRLIKILYPIPLIYQKYLGFGFNVKRTSSNFIDDKLHIYTTEDGGVALDSLNIENSSKEFVEAVFAGKVNYSDIELQLVNTPLSHNALYSLLDYHKLHYQVDNNLILEPEEQLIIKQKKYVSDFAIREYSGNKYIKQRISAIYKFWCNQGWLNIELRDWFLQFDFEIEKDSETKKQEQDIFKNENILKLSKDKAFNFLQYNIKQLKNVKIKEAVIHIGLEYLLGKVGRLLDNETVYNTILDLLTKENLSLKLRWKNKYPKINDQLPIDKQLRATTDIIVFRMICNAFIENYADKYNNLVKDFVQNCITLPGNRELDFYQSAFDLAKKYGFKLTVKYSKGKSQELFEMFKLFNNNLEQIDNSNILDIIASDFIETTFPKTISEILNFSYHNQDFTQKYNQQIIQQFIQILQHQKSENRYKDFVFLLKEIEKTKQNPLLKENIKLFEVLKEIKLDKKQVSEISKLSKSIAKYKIEDNTQYLLQQIENWNDEYKKNNVEPNNSKHTIMWIAGIAIITLFIILIGLNSYYSNQIKHDKTEPVILDSNQEILNSINCYRDTIAQLRTQLNTIMDSMALNPYPNSELNENDLKKLWKKGSKSNQLEIGLKIDSVVKIIFIKNPGDIEKYYKEREAYYSKLLIKKNPNCFDSNSILRDSIRYIPSHRSQN